MLNKGKCDWAVLKLRLLDYKINVKQQYFLFTHCLLYGECTTIKLWCIKIGPRTLNSKSIYVHSLKFLAPEIYHKQLGLSYKTLNFQKTWHSNRHESTNCILDQNTNLLTKDLDKTMHICVICTMAYKH